MTDTNGAERGPGGKTAAWPDDEALWQAHPPRAVTAVEALPEAYLLRLAFDDGVVKVLDFEPYLAPKDPRRDLALFRQVATDGFVPVWPNGWDCDADVLYYDDLYPASWHDEPGMTPEKLSARKTATVRETSSLLPAATD